MDNKVLLVILDGWGWREHAEGNAAIQAHTPHLDRVFKSCPWARLEASGDQVGLPPGQQGNSEVGHLNLGAGRIVDQDLVRIDKTIRQGLLGEQRVLQDLFDRIRQRGGRLHLLGLLSDGGVHSHQSQLEALLDAAQTAGIQEAYVHAFLDGRDVSPRSALGYIASLEERMEAKQFGRIATVSGRYYAMDRDQRYDRVEKAWQAIVHAQGPQYASATAGVQASYEAEVSDEFVVPFVVAGAKDLWAPLGPDDGLMFFNFRADRGRQLTAALGLRDFDGFDRGAFHPLDIVTLTEYDAEFAPHIPAVFGPAQLAHCLGPWLSSHGKAQLRLAETEKYAHVTFFFNGGVETAWPKEDRVLIPSPQVATYDLQPEMRAETLAQEVVRALRDDTYDFILVNFANPDMVGHTGVFPAAIRSVEAVDQALGDIFSQAEAMGVHVLVTADHGNCEQMIQDDGSPFTAHTTNPVPIILCGGPEGVGLRHGNLSDVAPTVLELMGLPSPEEMTGKSLLVEREDLHE